MGLRASQLRNRQQDSAAVSSAGGDVRALCNGPNDSTNGGIAVDNDNFNNNNNDNIDDDVTRIKEALHAAVGSQQNGDTQQQLDQNKQQANGNSAVGSKFSTLQHQASHLQSLAQRIKRSSSVRRFIPSFVSGKRKVSV